MAKFADLDALKYEVAAELVPQIAQYGGSAKVDPGSALVVPDASAVGDYNALKFEIANELGIALKPGYNGELTTRDAGRIGGKIGGNMVRRMIEFAEAELARRGGL